MKSRVIIVVNKYWECDPVCAVLTSAYLSDPGLGLENPVNIGPSDKVTRNFNRSYPSYGAVTPPAVSETVPRITYVTDEKIIEVWCISDLLSNSEPEDQSSSEEKGKLLPIIFNYDKSNEIELVVAVGTASSGPSVQQNHLFPHSNINGSVVIGSNVFMHDGIIGDSTSSYDPENHFECRWGAIESAGNTDFIEALQKIDFSQYQQLLLATSVNPSPDAPAIYVNKGFVAIGDVNVTDYTQYKENDQAAGDQFFRNYPNLPEHENGVSVETTHCLIYQAAKDHLRENPPFIFVSGVVDRFTEFAEDVSPKVYAQNVAGGNNAGAAVAIIIAELLK